VSTLGHQIQQTESRYRRCREQRENRAEHLDLLRRGRGGDWRQVDDPSRVLNRLISLDQQELAGDAMASLGPRRADRAAPEGVVPEVPVLERILAENDLLGVTFLLKGALVSRAVGRVAIRRGSRVVGFGTGFLVSPRLLLTNNHVLPDAASAATSTIQFNFFETDPGRPTRPVEFRLRPGEFFRTDPGLDFTLVAVESRAGDAALAGRGWIPLVAGSGKAVVGERVNIIQHPGGEPQQVAVHQNEIVDVVDDFLHYSTDTERGSSGSPVFNERPAPRRRRPGPGHRRRSRPHRRPGR
jgi:endonuclease G, mitochondrial